MFIVWGKKRVEKAIGYAADFCPLCRTVTPFRIVRVGMASHLYYLTVGQGECIGHTGSCARCGTALEVDVTKYQGLWNQPGMDMDALIAGTFPNLRTTYAQRLDLEAKVQADTAALTPQERRALLMQPFRLLSAQVEKAYASARFDKESGIGCLGSIALAALVVGIASYATKHGPTQDRLMLAAGVVFVVGLVYTFIQLALGPGRFLRRVILPRLSTALKPLNPTKEEIASCLDQLRGGGLRIGRKLRVESVWAALQKADSSKTTAMTEPRG